MKECSSRQQIKRDDVDASPFMTLLSASVIRVPDELFSVVKARGGERATCGGGTVKERAGG